MKGQLDKRWVRGNKYNKENNVENNLKLTTLDTKLILSWLI